jgi:hypothetical protein
MHCLAVMKDLAKLRGDIDSALYGLEERLRVACACLQSIRWMVYVAYVNEVPMGERATT